MRKKGQETILEETILLLDQHKEKENAADINIESASRNVI